MAAHSSILAWRIPWMEEPGGLWSMGLQRDWHSLSNLARMHALSSLQNCWEAWRTELEAIQQEECAESHLKVNLVQTALLLLLPSVWQICRQPCHPWVHDSDSDDSEWEMNWWELGPLPCSNCKGDWGRKGLLSFSRRIRPPTEIYHLEHYPNYEGIWMLTAQKQNISPTD